MSQKRTYELICPSCKQDLSAELYESINVEENPELKELLMTNQLNTTTCTQCETAFRVDKPLLYNDPAKRIMIYWLPVKLEAKDQGEQEFRDSLQQLTAAMPDDVQLPEVHLVFSRTELIERIFMFEEELDERIIEYIKYTIFTKNLQKVDPESKILLFNAQDSTDEALCFVVQDVASMKFEAVLQYQREAYDALCEMFDEDEETANLMELFPGPHISARNLLLSEASKESE